MAKSTKRIVRATFPNGATVERGSEKATYTHAALVLDAGYPSNGECPAYPGGWFVAGFSSSKSGAEKMVRQYQAPRFKGHVVEVEVVTERPS